MSHQVNHDNTIHVLSIFERNQFKLNCTQKELPCENKCCDDCYNLTTVPYFLCFYSMCLIAIHDHHIISLWIFWYYWHLWSGSYVINPSDCNCHYYDGLLHYIMQYQSSLWMWRSITSSLEWHHFDGYTWKCTKTAATSNE